MRLRAKSSVRLMAEGDVREIERTGQGFMPVGLSVSNGRPTHIHLIALPHSAERKMGKNRGPTRKATLEPVLLIVNSGSAVCARFHPPVQCRHHVQMGQ